MLESATCRSSYVEAADGLLFPKFIYARGLSKPPPQKIACNTQIQQDRQQCGKHWVKTNDRTILTTTFTILGGLSFSQGNGNLTFPEPAHNITHQTSQRKFTQTIEIRFKRRPSADVLDSTRNSTSDRIPPLPEHRCRGPVIVDNRYQRLSRTAWSNARQKSLNTMI